MWSVVARRSPKRRVPSCISTPFSHEIDSLFAAPDSYSNLMPNLTRVKADRTVTSLSSGGQGQHVRGSLEAVGEGERRTQRA